MHHCHHCNDCRRPAFLVMVGLAAALAVGLSGCSLPLSAATQNPPMPLPAHWLATVEGMAPSTEASPLATWWQNFNDPQLSSLVTRALQANPTVLGAQAALQQARALRDVQAAGLQPSVAASASGQRSRAAGLAAANSFQAGLDASWELDLFGARRSALAASEAEADAAQSGVEGARVSLAAEVGLNYIQLRSLQQRLAIARSNLLSQQETLQITQWRLQAGLTTSLVAEQARTAAEQTAAQIPTLEASLAQTRHALAVLTAQPPGALHAALQAPAALPQPADGLALTLPAETLRQRPDVRAAEQRITAALARLSQADAARYPSLRITGSLGLRALTFGGLADGASVANALLGSVSVPLLDGGAARAQVRVQEAALEQARLNYQSAVLTALKEVEDALVALRGDRERLLSLQNAADAAANAALLAQQRYASGLIDFASVLETQRTLLSTQDALAVTAASVSADHVRLYKALGGGWQPGS